MYIQAHKDIREQIAVKTGFVYVCTQFVVVFLTFNGHQNPRPGLTRLLHTPC